MPDRRDRVSYGRIRSAVCLLAANTGLDAKAEASEDLDHLHCLCHLHNTTAVYVVGGIPAAAVY